VLDADLDFTGRKWVLLRPDSNSEIKASVVAGKFNNRMNRLCYLEERRGCYSATVLLGLILYSLVLCLVCRIVEKRCRLNEN